MSGLGWGGVVCWVSVFVLLSGGGGGGGGGGKSCFKGSSR